MADRIKLRRGPKNNIDLNVYELGYATDSDEERLYFNNGSMVPIPNNKDITDIKTELTETTNVTNKNKQDVSELKESVAGIIKTGVAKLVQYSYDIELSESTKKVNIPYEMYSSVTDTLKVYVNGLAIQNDQYTITDPVENDGIVTNGYIVLKVERPAGTIVRIEVWKNVPSGEEGEVSGNIIAQNSLPLDRIIGIDNITSKISQLSNPNLLINGDFRVWQRGTSFNLSKNDVKYTSDRWKIWCNNDTPIKISNENGLKFEGSNSNLYYHFEDADFNKINNKEVTMSVMVDDNVYTETFVYNGNNNWTELFENDKIQLAYNGTTKSIELGLIKSVTIKWIKLELGSVATPFVPRSYGEELALCQRYYEYIQRCIGITNPSMDNLRGQYPFKVTKRIIPNIKYGFGELENVIACVKASNNELFTIKPTTDPSSNEYGIIIDSNLGMNDYKYWEFYAKADAEIY